MRLMMRHTLARLHPVRHVEATRRLTVASCVVLPCAVLCCVVLMRTGSVMGVLSSGEQLSNVRQDIKAGVGAACIWEREVQKAPYVSIMAIACMGQGQDVCMHACSTK